MIRFRATVDATRGTAEFRQAGREVRGRTRQGLVSAGERVVLPEARTLAGNLRVEGDSVAGSLLVRARASDAYLTTRFRGRKARAVGLLHFGGTVHGTIVAKHRRRGGGPGALRLRNGVFAQRITRPRRYRGRFFLTRAVDQTRGRIADEVLREVMKAFGGLPHTP